jgi:hypothetical protein
MKRYWLFNFDSFEPSGGMYDLIFASDSLHEIINIIPEIKSPEQNFHIFDCMEVKLSNSFGIDDLGKEIVFSSLKGNCLKLFEYI